MRRTVSFWIRVLASALGAGVFSLLPVRAQTNCLPAPVGLVSWWRGEGNAADSAGVNAGFVQGGVTFTAGEVGQSFSFNGTNADVAITRSPTLNVGAADGFTVEAWINPTDLSIQHPIAEWNSGSGPSPIGVHFWVSDSPGGGPTPGTLYANLIDTTGIYHALGSAAGLV